MNVDLSILYPVEIGYVKHISTCRARQGFDFGKGPSGQQCSQQLFCGADEFSPEPGGCPAKQPMGAGAAGAI